MSEKQTHILTSSKKQHPFNRKTSNVNPVLSIYVKSIESLQNINSELKFTFKLSTSFATDFIKTMKTKILN